MMKKILKALPVAFVLFLLLGSTCSAAVINEKFDGFSSHDASGYIGGVCGKNQPLEGYSDSYIEGEFKHNDEVIKYEQGIEV